MADYTPILDWLHKLEQPYKSQAIYNHGVALQRFLRLHPNPQRIPDDYTLADSLSQALDRAFTWSMTPQGQDYWVDFHNLLIVREAEERERLLEKNKVTFSTSMYDMLCELKRNGSVVATVLLDIERTTREFCNYVTMRGYMCSYLPNGREHKVNEETGRWLRDGRQDMKPAKLARRLIQDEYLQRLNDSDFEKFSNDVNAYISVTGDEDGVGRNVRLSVIKGVEIRDAYNENYYSKMAGTNNNLWGSCMRYDGCQSYFGIYEKNSNVSMLVAYDSDNLVLGRALLWQFEDGDKGMDTIYASEKLFPAFINWAVENKYYYKASQSCHHHSFNMYDREMVDSKPRSVKLEQADFGSFPYLDTLYYLSLYHKRLTNDGGFSYDYTLRCTGGGYEEQEDEDRVTDMNGEMIDSDDARYLCYTRPNGNRVEGYMHYEDCTYCEDGEYYLDDDTVSVDGDHYFIGDEDIVELWDGDYARRDDATYVDAGSKKGDYALSDEVVCLYNGEWIYQDEAEQCCVDDEYYELDEIEKMENGDWVASCNMEQYLEQLKETTNA